MIFLEVNFFEYSKSVWTARTLFKKKMGMSQEKFALSINMDRTYLASVEAGRRNIFINNIKKIAEGLNITISELFMEVEISEKK